MGFPFMAGSSPAGDVAHAVGRNAARTRECARRCASVTAAWTATIFTAWRPSSAWWSGGSGGETGVKWVQAYRGDNFWKAHQEGVWPQELFDAALCRSHTLKPAREGFNDIFPTRRRHAAHGGETRWPTATSTPTALMSTMILLTGMIEDFNFAARIEGRAEPFSTQMYLPMPPGRTTLANFFSPLVNHAEKMFLTGKPSYPVERTLLTTGLTAAGVESLYRKRKALRHAAPGDPLSGPTKESTYWRT